MSHSVNDFALFLHEMLFHALQTPYPLVFDGFEVRVSVGPDVTSEFTVIEVFLIRPDPSGGHIEHKYRIDARDFATKLGF